MTKCRLCERDCEPSSALCEYHLAAKRNIEAGYARWTEAYGAITWIEYLKRIQENAETGHWAKEVVKQLLVDEPVDR